MEKNEASSPAVWFPRLAELIREEVRERQEEGCKTQGFLSKIDEIFQKSLPRQEQFRRLMEIYQELEALPVSEDFPYQEPDQFDDILALSDDPSGLAGLPVPRDALYDRLYGAWLGRCIGCAMGKPLETFPYMGGKDGMPGYLFVREYLEGAASYPLSGYVPGTSAAQKDGLTAVCPRSQREQIQYMETDDDIRYLVLALMLAEKHGNDFSRKDIETLWLENLPAGLTFTAERRAYFNAMVCEETDPERRRRYITGFLNPYREWIGAQIRADGYAYVNAGHPLSAVKAAYTDASFSHTKNGLYGAMFIAAAIASAFSYGPGDEEKVVRTALHAVPKTSRLYEAILAAEDIAKESLSQEEVYEALWKKFGHYHGVHTINNAAVCTAALCFAEGDFTKALSTAVCAGWDTDCNGATVGSILGALYGASKIPEALSKPLHDTLYSFVPGFHPIAISECARRSEAVYRRLYQP